MVAENDRARRFYEDHGRRDDGAFVHHAPGPRGAVPVPAHRSLKILTALAAGAALDSGSGPIVARARDGRTIRLRRPVPEDAAGVAGGARRPAGYQYDPDETQTELADAERFLSPVLAHWAVHASGYWTVLVLNVYFRLAVAVQGRGVAGLILREAINFAAGGAVPSRPTDQPFGGSSAPGRLPSVDSPVHSDGTFHQRRTRRQ